MFSITQSLLYGLLFSAVFGVVVVVSLRFNPRLWLQDFPAAIRATQPPLTAQERRHKGILTVVFLIMLLGIPSLIVAQLRAADNGSLTFIEAYLTFWIAFQMVNLFDAVVLDWLWLVEMHPKFIILPGTEGLMHLMVDKRMHLVNFVKGVVITSILALPFAFVAVV